MVDAVRVLADQVANRAIDPKAIDSAALERELASMAVGPVDLLIRTGGEQRISNFLLWGAAYAELHFTDELWPDFGANSLYHALSCYQTRERRFGLVTDDCEDAKPPVRRSRVEHVL